MKSLTLICLALLACSKPAEEASQPEPAPNAAGSSQLAPESEPFPVGAFAVRLGDQQAGVDVRMPDSRLERSGDALRLYLYGEGGWGLVTSFPEQEGTHDLAALRTTLTDPEITDHALSTGTLSIDAVDPASGRLAFTVRGETAEGVAVAINVDTTVTPPR